MRKWTEEDRFFPLISIGFIVTGLLLAATHVVWSNPKKTLQQDKIEVKRLPADTVFVDTCYYSQAIDHIKSYEGFRSTCYRDNDGSLTIGYGHHLRKGENYSVIDTVIGEKLLVEDLTKCINYIEKITDLRNNKSLAMGMLAYNCGTGRVDGYIKRGLLDSIEALPQYCHYTSSNGIWVKSKKLQERRIFELKIYKNGV